MSVKPKPAKIEEQRLRAILKVRERQFQIAVGALKRVIEFKSAHLSVFETEVHALQLEATAALVRMEQAQSGKWSRQRPKTEKSPVALKQLIHARKVMLNELYGPLGSKGGDDNE